MTVYSYSSLDPDRDLDPDQNWPKILVPDSTSMYLDQQHCTPQLKTNIVKINYFRIPISGKFLILKTNPTFTSKFLKCLISVSLRPRVNT